MARAPGLPPTGQTSLTPRDSILPSTYLLVRLDQRFAIDPYPPSLRHFAMRRVTWLEPRTPHQPGKLQKLPKNERVFTPSIFRVNKKRPILSARKSMECKPSTAICRASGAALAMSRSHAPHASTFFRARRASSRRHISQPGQTLIVKISAGIRPEAGFAPMR
jgi:hypothetical protein